MTYRVIYLNSPGGKEGKARGYEVTWDVKVLDWAQGGRLAARRFTKAPPDAAAGAFDLYGDPRDAATEWLLKRFQ